MSIGGRGGQSSATAAAHRHRIHTSHHIAVHVSSAVLNPQIVLLTGSCPIFSLYNPFEFANDLLLTLEDRSRVFKKLKNLGNYDDETARSTPTES